jgi:hypothetical protein
MIVGVLAQDGARAYFLLPEDTNIVGLTTNYLHSEFSGSTVEVGAVTASYRRTIDVGGKAGAILIGLPIGALSGMINIGSGIVAQDTNLAVGDLIIGGELGLLGSPSLSPLDYSQYKPGPRAGVAAKLFIPTGDYDSSRLVSLGQNRWSLQASLPISYVLGDSMIDPTITTFEIVPSVHIFGNNNDAVGPGTSVSTQDPLWKLEGHVTHTFSPMVWAALDGYAEAGGRATVDGTEVPGAHQSASLGATLGLVLSRTVSMRLNYTQLVYSNVPNSVGRSVELTTAFTF